MPATRFSVDAYVHFVREKTLLEAVASSLTELFSPAIIGERVARHAGGLRFHHARRRSPISTSVHPRPTAMRSSRSITSSGTRRRAAEQQAVIAALAFKCDVLWTMLDALMYAYVAPGHIPPGAFVPDAR